MDLTEIAESVHNCLGVHHYKLPSQYTFELLVCATKYFANPTIPPWTHSFKAALLYMASAINQQNEN